MGTPLGDGDKLLRRLVEAVESTTGEAFFRSLVQHLAEALGVSYAFVSELTQGGSHFRSLAVWERGAPGRPFEIPLAGTPCEAVLGGALTHHPEGLQALFPADTGLVEWGVQSYAGAPMLGADGRVLGHFAVFDTVAMPEARVALDVMRVFAARAAAELERQHAEAELRRSQIRFQRIVDTLQDGVVSYGRDFRLWLFNRAAGRILRCAPEDALGQSAMRFATADGGSAALAAIARLEEHPDELIFLGAEDGVTARRADDTTFVQECSLSRSEVDGEIFYTVVFRDAEERQRAGRDFIESLHRQNQYLQEEIRSFHNFEEIVGRSPAFARVLEEVEQVAGTDASVLIRGETGTGKELVARAVHAQSPRRDRPLVKVNCAALSPGLVESELFGHEKGAFTGAAERRIGRFELADGGTLLLDEVGEIPLDVQVKLLRVLQEREFERVGGGRTLRADVRVIAATNRDLEAAVVAGTFRRDLYYRLNVFPVSLPPLRERPEDVPLLASFFAARYAARLGRSVEGVSPATLERLRAYAWPGNVRELENVIERAVILARGPWLEVPPEVLGMRGGAAPVPPAPPAAPSLDAVQRRHIEETLRATGWRIEGPAGAALRLGLSPSTLRSRMKKLGIRREGSPA